ncbi:hypothetical protein APHAL10511_007636 [Amanita phalloides]|nr:hypothetical protein APHAL10511_007636 [Amanita phalloides]
MSGLTPEDMQDGAFWAHPSFQLLPPCPHCETGLCSAHSSGGFLTATMEAAPLSLQDYLPVSPINPRDNYALQASPSPLDYGYSAAVMSDTFHYPHVNSEGVLQLTGTENLGNHGAHGTRPPYLQINTGVFDAFYGQIASPLDSANTDASSAAFIPFVPTPEEPRTVQISENIEYKACVGSDAMKAASKRRRTTNHRSFQCKYCGDNLTSSHNLKYHIDAHFGIRPHKCPNAGCTFATTAPATAKRHYKKCKHGQS